jgi:hypothetical protein
MCAIVQPLLNNFGVVSCLFAHSAFLGHARVVAAFAHNYNLYIDKIYEFKIAHNNNQQYSLVRDIISCRYLINDSIYECLDIYYACLY